MLCTVRDARQSLAEIRRVLRPGGELRFFERVRADSRGMAATQRVLDRTVRPLLTGGCHTSRDAPAAIEAAGFVVEARRDIRIPESGARLPTSACVVGVARRTQAAKPVRSTDG